MLHWSLRMLLIGDESTFVLTGNLNADKGRTLRNSTTLILFQKSMQCMQANIAITIPILSRISNQELQVVCKHVGAAIISYLKSLEYCI